MRSWADIYNRRWLLKSGPGGVSATALRAVLLCQLAVLTIRRSTATASESACWSSWLKREIRVWRRRWRACVAEFSAGHNDLGLLAADILALTKLDWNNDSPYKPLPVMLEYTKKLAEVVSNVQKLDDNVCPHRLFL